MVAVLAHITTPLPEDPTHTSKIYVIGYYGKPDETALQENLLKNFMDHIHSIDPHPHIVIAGDFNKPIHQARALEPKLNCWMAQNAL